MRLVHRASLISLGYEGRSGDPAGRDRFCAVLADESASRDVDHIAELLDGRVVALLCFERTHEQCHRHLVAEAVREVVPLVVVPLTNEPTSLRGAAGMFEVVRPSSSQVAGNDAGFWQAANPLASGVNPIRALPHWRWAYS